MVLFDEDPVTLIRETTHQFHITPDKESLTRISGSLHTLSTARAQRLTYTESILKSLNRRLNTLQSQQHFEEERHDAAKHAEEMLRMDTEKFRIAKGVSDVEIEGERLESELKGLVAQLEVLDREGVEGGRRGRAGSEDETVLRLQFYRSLGIDVSQDDEGVFRRAVVRNPDKGDVNVVHVDGTMSRSFYANMCWDSL